MSGKRGSRGRGERRRIVVKMGTNLLTGGGDRLDVEVMAVLVGQVAALHRQGHELIVVTSGAIAAGREKLGLISERRDIASRQVMAAVGQNSLMSVYEGLFSRHGIVVAQTLLTRADLCDRLGYLNARNTLLALLELKVVPIVNENDVVAVEEIEGVVFGDNDNLSAMVANLVDAELLVLLGDVAGLHTRDPVVDPDAELIPLVECIDARIERLAGGTRGRGSGGMATKVQAAKLATASGAAVVIAHGRERDVLVRLVSGESIGTLFPAATSSRESRKRWMLSGLATRGRLAVDDGAARALREHKRSLLPAGVVEASGEFQRGDIVDIVDSTGVRIACGIASYSAEDIALIKGVRSGRIQEVLGHTYGDEAVHRNNLVVL